MAYQGGRTADPLLVDHQLATIARRGTIVHCRDLDDAAAVELPRTLMRTTADVELM